MQFSLQTLMLVFVVAWSSLAVFGAVGGVVVFVLAVGLAIYVNQIKSFWSLTNLVCLLVCLMFLIALLLPAVSPAREAARRSQCCNQMKQIALALHNYAQANGCLPPAYIADKNGKPMHSWRVLILPYMGEGSLYNTYSFNEPWDGPNNKKLLASRPRGHACPSDEHSRMSDLTITNYVAVVGKDAAWAGEKPTHFDELSRGGGVSNTIILVEVANSGIQWTEPRDLSLDALQADDAKTPVLTLSSKHMCDLSTFFYTCTVPSKGGNVALADGSVRFLWANPSATEPLRRILKIGGCDLENGAYVDGFTPEGEVWQFNWGNCLALAIWLASVGVLLRRAVRSRKPRETVVESAGIGE